MITKAERTAVEILEKARIRKPPVDVESLAIKYFGVKLRFEHLEQSVSGMLYRTNDEAFVAVNSDHAKVRQRFTIAHELGHFELHQGRPIIVDHLVRARVNLRNSESSLATNREEIDANGFAASLLMPAEWILTDVDQRLNRTPARLVAELAKRYVVSEQAMQLRLINIGVRATP
jgi:Zn-dependent peptidase ImmA (M78 family)